MTDPENQSVSEILTRLTGIERILITLYGKVTEGDDMPLTTSLLEQRLMRLEARVERLEQRFEEKK